MPRSRANSPSIWSTGLGLTILIASVVSCRQAASSSSGEASLSAFVELDHLYVYAPAQSAEQEVVAAFEKAGFRVSAYRRRFADGVVGRYVVFHNAYLELLWCSDNRRANAETRQRAAWVQTGASPFGVGLRRLAGVPDGQKVPFLLRSPRSTESRSGISRLGDAKDTLFPAIFVVPESMAHTSFEALSSVHSTLTAEERAREIQDRTHPLGVRTLTRAFLMHRAQRASRVSRALDKSGIIELGVGTQSLMTVEFDGAAGKHTRDFRPLLPLVMRY